MKPLIASLEGESPKFAGLYKGSSSGGNSKNVLAAALAAGERRIEPARILGN
jgi:hypothetical protein